MNSEIQSYIKKLKIKKAVVGGFDQEAVYTAMQELSSMYQQEILQIKEEKQRLETEHQAAADRIEQSEKEIQRLKLRLEEGQRNQSKYDLRFTALSQAIEAVNANRETVLEESKKAAEEIVARAGREAEEIRQKASFQKRQQEQFLSKMENVKEQFDTSMESLHSILTKMLSEIDALQKDGLERVPIVTGSGSCGDESQNNAEDETHRLIQMIAGSVGRHGSGE